MAFGQLNHSSSQAPLAEINMIPLIDVVLVLLIIFMITAPMMTHSIKVNLPETSALVDQTPMPITVSINAQGDFYLNNKAVDAVQLTQQFLAEAAKPTPAQLQIRADKAVDYGIVAKVMALASKSGLNKIGFVTQAEE